MPEVTFYGASDDLIEVEGESPGCDEYNAESGTFLVVAGEARCNVRVVYESNGCWSIAIWPTDDGVLMPFAEVSRRDDTAYSAQAKIYGVDHVARVSA